MPLDIPKCATAERPLLAIPAGKIAIREGEIVFRPGASGVLSRWIAQVLLYESRKMHKAFGQK